MILKRKELHEIAKVRNISLDTLESVLKAEFSETDRMLSLKHLGYSIGELASAYNISSQAVHHRIGYTEPAVWSQSLGDEITRTVDQVRLECWAEAMTDLGWWTSRSRMDRARLVERYISYGYNWEDARSCATYASGSKLAVILQIQYNVGPTQSLHKSWLQEMSNRYTKNEIFTMINEGQALQVPYQTFFNYWARLRIVAVVREPAR